MILTDREIRIALTQRMVEIDPLPDLDVAVSSTAIDLRLASRFMQWQATGGLLVRPGDRSYSYADFAKFQVEHNGSYPLEPKSFVLAWTLEKVAIPHLSRLAARVEGKSSLARLGVGIHVTAPIIHSGFKGQIQLEIFNFGPHQVMLDPGMFICQLVFEQTVGTPDRGYTGIFADQTAAGLAAKPA
ncbi:dCTP deaminase [Salinarimonas sp. NSM]|uniref:dCTP deaminase n=1 Tax=Salinarimonas sp. NSM TaxID=3458003 RepID=UPI004035380B